MTTFNQLNVLIEAHRTAEGTVVLFALRELKEESLRWAVSMALATPSLTHNLNEIRARDEVTETVHVLWRAGDSEEETGARIVEACKGV